MLKPRTIMRTEEPALRQCRLTSSDSCLIGDASHSSPCQVRATEEPPKEFKGLPAQAGLKPGDIPTLQTLGLSAPKQQKVRIVPCLGLRQPSSHIIPFTFC